MPIQREGGITLSLMSNGGEVGGLRTRRNARYDVQ
jgi:hypothetical protein